MWPRTEKYGENSFGFEIKLKKANQRFRTPWCTSEHGVSRLRATVVPTSSPTKSSSWNECNRTKLNSAPLKIYLRNNFHQVRLELFSPYLQYFTTLKRNCESLMMHVMGDHLQKITAMSHNNANECARCFALFNRIRINAFGRIEILIICLRPLTPIYCYYYRSMLNLGWYT